MYGFLRDGVAFFLSFKKPYLPEVVSLIRQGVFSIPTAILKRLQSNVY